METTVSVGFASEQPFQTESELISQTNIQDFRGAPNYLQQNGFSGNRLFVSSQPSLLSSAAFQCCWISDEAILTHSYS